MPRGDLTQQHLPSSLLRRQYFWLSVSRRIRQSPAKATNLLRNLAPALPAHMLLLASKWKRFLLMFSLSSLGSMQSLSLPPFFSTVFRASAQTAGSLILQIMPSTVTFYSSSTGPFCPRKMSQHCGFCDRCCVLPLPHRWACVLKQSHSCKCARWLVATSVVALSDYSESWHVPANSCSSWRLSPDHVSVGLGLVPHQVHRVSPWTFKYSALLSSFHCRSLVVNFTCMHECHS